MNPPVIFLTILLVVILFIVPKKHLLVPFILAACFIPPDQRIIIATLDFTPLRMLVITGVLRGLIKGEKLTFKLTRFDKLVLAWALCGAIIYVFQWSSTSALIYKSGALFDLIGLYWLFRTNIRSWEQVKRVINVFAICSLVLAGFVAVEWATGQNLFNALGHVATSIRISRYRCQASFPHPIMLGAFWATLFPLFLGLAKSTDQKWFYWASTAAVIFIVCATWSSTPILTLIAIACLLPLFNYRYYTRIAARVLCILLVALHLVMEAPVWHLLCRVKFIDGSTGYHRYKIIDAAVNHFGEWVLLGTKSTNHWGWGLKDITNQYVLEGVRGGALTLGLFVAVLVVGFQTLERHFNQTPHKQDQWLGWCIFVSLLGHCISFIGTSYFGQITALWYLTLAMIGYLAENREQKHRHWLNIHSLRQWLGGRILLSRRTTVGESTNL